MKYKKEPKGRVAIFLIPSVKLKIHMPDGRTVEKAIDEFLKENYGGYSYPMTNMSGIWNNVGVEFYDEHRAFSAAFLGKERIAELDDFLAEIAMIIGEESIFVQTGEDAYTVTPEPDQPTEEEESWI